MPKRRKEDDCPNRLFLSYLQTWKNEAEAKESKACHTYNKAYKSLKKYPLPLQCGKEAIILECFGDKICAMLDNKLAKDAKGKGITPREYLEESRTVSNSWWESLESNSANTPKSKIKKSDTTNTKRSRAYIPARNSGGFAILLALYENKQSVESMGYMKKAELQREAQKYSTKSFTVPEPGSQYTAWSSMATLLTKELVKKSGNPAKFELTESGCLLAAKLECISPENTKQTKLKEFNFKNASNNLKTTLGVQNKLPVQKLGYILSDSEPEVMDAKELPKLEVAPNLSEHLADKPKHNIEFKLTPGNFDIVLCVDSREVSGDKRKAQMRREISKSKIPHVERVLQIGDFIWIAKEKSQFGSSSKELVLDYVIERKCMSDLAQSIKDGRFHEQKIRLKQCGIKNIIYLVEDFNQIQHQSLPEKTLRQALYNTLVGDKIFIKNSQNIAATVMYLNKMTAHIQDMYKHQTLMACDMNIVTSSAKETELNCKLLSFHDFNDESMKCRGLTVTDMFIRQLMQIHGMSYDKALAITQLYSTPFKLFSHYNSLCSNKEKEELLMKVKTGLLERNLGINLSRCVYHTFCG